MRIPELPRRIPSEIHAPLLERGVIATYDSGTIRLTPADTIYFTVPANLVDLLYTRYGVDLIEKRKRYNIYATLVEERKTDGKQLISILLKSVESIINQITAQPLPLDSATLYLIEQQLKTITSTLTNPPTIPSPIQTRIIYELELKPEFIRKQKQ
jgi:hypothetical protein